MDESPAEIVQHADEGELRETGVRQVFDAPRNSVKRVAAVGLDVVADLGLLLPDVPPGADALRGHRMRCGILEGRDLQDGAEGQNRTGDTTIFSRMLYQLSYLGLRNASARNPNYNMTLP